MDINTATATAEQIDALADYAAKNGRTWKSKLRAAWEAGGYDAQTGEYIAGPLQEVRNQLGPSWLNSYALPRIVSRASDISLGGWR